MDQLNCSASEDDIAVWIDTIKNSKKDACLLLNILPREHKLYKERGTTQVNRIRGYCIAAFEKTGLPDKALKYVCEELDNSHSPYLIAASAAAVRGFKYPIAEFTDFLLKALTRVIHKDEALSFSQYKPEWPLKNFTSATREILVTLIWLGANAYKAVPVLKDYSNGIPTVVNKENRELIIKTIEEIQNSRKKLYADDCCSFMQPTSQLHKLSIKEANSIQLQDQEGNKQTFRDFFTGSVSVVSFFYTRCDNPNKCSATLTKLAQLQTMLKVHNMHNVKVSAITYDSAYDTAERLKIYAANRGIQYNNFCKIFRVLNEQENILQKYFSSKVNYNSSIVNHHSIELFILNKSGNIVNEFSRKELNIEEIITAVKKIEQTRLRILKKISSATVNSILPVIMLLFPKCPICWAGYLSLFGLSDITWLRYNPNFYWLIILFASVNLFFMYLQARKKSYYLPVATAFAGYILLALTLATTISKTVQLFAIGLIIFSSLMCMLNIRKLKAHFKIKLI